MLGDVKKWLRANTTLPLQLPNRPKQEEKEEKLLSHSGDDDQRKEGDEQNGRGDNTILVHALKNPTVTF